MVSAYSSHSRPTQAYLRNILLLSYHVLPITRLIVCLITKLPTVHVSNNLLYIYGSGFFQCFLNCHVAMYLLTILPSISNGIQLFKLPSLPLVISVLLEVVELEIGRLFIMSSQTIIGFPIGNME